MVRAVTITIIHGCNILGKRSYDINCTQTSSSVHSPALLFKSTSAFFRTMFEKRLPIPLMAVMANMTLRLPSMFVLRIRKMCWNFSGMTKDWKTRWLDHKSGFVQWRHSRQTKRCRPNWPLKISNDGRFARDRGRTVRHFVRFTRRLKWMKNQNDSKLTIFTASFSTKTRERTETNLTTNRSYGNVTTLLVGLDAIGGGSGYLVNSSQRCQHSPYSAGPVSDVCPAI